MQDTTRCHRTIWVRFQKCLNNLRAQVALTFTSSQQSIIHTCCACLRRKSICAYQKHTISEQACLLILPSKQFSEVFSESRAVTPSPVFELQDLKYWEIPPSVQLHHLSTAQPITPSERRNYSCWQNQIHYNFMNVQCLNLPLSKQRYSKVNSKTTS